MFSRSGDVEPKNLGVESVREKTRVTSVVEKSVRPRVANQCDGVTFRAFSISVFSRSGYVEPKKLGLESVRKKLELNDLSKKTRASTGRESVRRCSVLSIFDFCVFAFGRC